jgi:2-amino-4-hydroxy-6-hydroxymethyldihydropteridine diphosphokinase
MILIAIGANLPGSDGTPALQTCRQGAARVRALPGLTFIALSPWYRSAAIPKSDQPDYCNGVIRLDGNPDPLSLLESLHAIEDAFGRVRSAPNAPRTLDLDLIDLNGTIREDRPILPHPRAHLRAFVLQPIADVAPTWRHRTLNATAGTLLKALPAQEIRLWEG